MVGLIIQYTRSSKYETEALISHAADAVGEHQSRAIVPPGTALRPARDIIRLYNKHLAIRFGVRDGPALGYLLTMHVEQGGYRTSTAARCCPCQSLVH